ncbi:hypothetical protein EYF80_022365 [Liparis tanakae]|uniref:Uncharacterized protein n=1 Tax=Liparis tanakae TaxID=230148 RepID=A0A4Z2HPA5_9TELE|nr:hypothetical protein EYF80_022365 [Liparis tanakae]
MHLHAALFKNNNNGDAADSPTRRKERKPKRRTIAAVSPESSCSRIPAADRKSHIMPAKPRDTRVSLKETRDTQDTRSPRAIKEEIPRKTKTVHNNFHLQSLFGIPCARWMRFERRQESRAVFILVGLRPTTLAFGQGRNVLVLSEANSNAACLTRVASVKRKVCLRCPEEPPMPGTMRGASRASAGGGSWRGASLGEDAKSPGLEPAWTICPAPSVQSLRPGWSSVMRLEMQLINTQNSGKLRSCRPQSQAAMSAKHTPTVDTPGWR